MSLRIVVQPTEELVTITQARLHLRLDGDGSSSDGSAEDELVEAMLGGAREWAERYLARSLATKTYELTLDAWPADGEIELRMPPVQSIASVQYVDTDGALQTLDASAYSLDRRTEPGWLLPAQGTSWPATADVVNAITIRYVAGFNTPGEEPQDFPLPKALRAGVLLLLHDLYENRGNSTEKPQTEVPMGAQALMSFWRLEQGV